jgi:hypothetical protein
LQSEDGPRQEKNPENQNQNKKQKKNNQKTTITLSRGYLKNNYRRKERAGGMTQMVACLFGKCMALSSNPSSTKRKERN